MDKSDQQIQVYDQSSILQKLIKQKIYGRHLKIAFVDIDSTLTGHTTVTKKTRIKLEKLGYAVVFVTARTEEMVMSKSEYEKSLTLGLRRPKPLLGRYNGKHVYIDPKEVNTNLVDPDIIIGSTGTQIVVKQIYGGYSNDLSFESQFKIISPLWRKNVLEIIKQIDPQEQFAKLALFENENMYYAGKTNIFPPRYRIQLNFDSLEGKIHFLQEMEKRNLLQSMQSSKPKTPISSLRIIDDSHPDKNQFLIYITPAIAYKGSAVEHVVDNLCRVLRKTLYKSRIKRSDIHVLLAGDSYPDLTMLLYGATGTKATAIVVGGSRLTRVLTHESMDIYAGENIRSLKKQLKITVGKVGHYNFQTNIDNDEVHIRNVIFGDSAFPKTKGPETILAFLEQLKINN